jgi:hypothetical protein
MKKDKMGGACSTHWAKSNALHFGEKTYTKGGNVCCTGADNIKINLNETVREVVVLIREPLDRGQWRALVNTVVNLQVP